MIVNSFQIDEALQLKPLSVEGISETQPNVYSADETADVGVDDATQVADKVFNDVEDSEFTGRVNKVTISIPKRK